MEEAWERQRRRRLVFAWTACAVLAAALVIAILRPGVPFLGHHAAASGSASTRRSSPTSTRRSRRSTPTSPPASTPAACSLLAPVVGTADLRADTDAVGIHGTCAQRLAGFARIVGPQVLSEVNPAWEQALLGDRRWGIQYGATNRAASTRAAGFAIGDPTLYPNLVDSERRRRARGPRRSRADHLPASARRRTLGAAPSSPSTSATRSSGCVLPPSLPQPNEVARALRRDRSPSRYHARRRPTRKRPVEQACRGAEALPVLLPCHRASQRGPTGKAPR